jgi:hypothetical protein
MIGVGNKILIPKKSDWIYEGELTVGNNYNVEYGWGYSDNYNFYLGSIDPEMFVFPGQSFITEMIYWHSWYGELYVGNFDALTASEININGTTYQINYLGIAIGVNSNPFPTAGVTHQIKLR